MNFSNAFDYLGIDTIHLYIELENVKEDEFLCALRIRHSKNKVPYYIARTKGVTVVKVLKGDFRYYKINFSLSKLYNGVNYSSYSPFEYTEIVNRLTLILLGLGLAIKDWNKVKVSRLDVFLNIELEKDYETCFPILNTSTLPRTKPRLHGNSRYLENKSVTLFAYDKKKQLSVRHKLEIQEDVLRLELRYLKGRKVKESLGSNLLKDIKPERIEKDFYKKLEKAFASLKDFEHQSGSLNRRSELIRYYREKGSRFPEKFGMLANKYFQIDAKGQLRSVLAHIIDAPFLPGKLIEAQRKKKERDVKTILESRKIGIYMQDLTRWSGSSIDVIRNAVFEKRLHIARLEDERIKPEQRKFKYKYESSLDLSLITFEDLKLLEKEII
ncbi:hypothetical protein [Leptospira noguchii]|uniref:Replication-associated protein G2P N-terminal domain-containing protein n=1 Tax=Leptospira noguchii TaxID=28182 RepID=M6VG83_9LEPT|nr:hypothetical protein [Leptospira noguchii]EMO55890.1 hypothetical protein LEP1GSC172_4079 [Leptospira noguchii]